MNSEEISVGGDEDDLASTRGKLWRSLARLSLGVFVVVVLAIYLHIGKTLIVVGALIAMIMVHELGHFVVAKVSGMKVTEYFLGFGPKLFSFRRGETEYGVKAIPAGGYVKIVGMSNIEELSPEDEVRSYRNSTFPRRLAVSVAGSFMHFVMAYLLLVALFLFVGVPSSNRIEISALSVAKGGVMTPAMQSGLKAGDVVYGINGKSLASPNQFVTVIQGSPNKQVSLDIYRNGTSIVVPVTPTTESKLNVASTSPSSAGVIGVHLVVPNESLPLLSSLGKPFSAIGSYSSQTISALMSHFSISGITNYVHALSHPATTTSGAGASARFESPVGIVRLASQAANVGIGAVVPLLFSINVFVGIFNLIPLLPLDGGHVVIAAYERVRSRKGKKYHADMMKMIPVTYAVLMVIVLLGVTALYLDITHPLANPFG
ncbi:MAG: M50 family metallopeptidase [Actinomycetota bacterium]|nr:M50 family metallopeptidase [Actinomycetota bacterium]